VSSNRRHDPGPPSGDCSLCGESVFAPGAVILFRSDGEARSVWHAHCAEAGAAELVSLAARARQRERLAGR
jgi:hypothetical protein